MAHDGQMSVNISLFSALLCMLFGANTVAIKFSLQGFGTFTNAGIRFILAAAAIYAWSRYRRIPLRLSGPQTVQMLMVGLVFSVQMSCFYLGLGKTTASHGVLIANLQPFVVMVLAHFFIPGDRITVKKGSGVCLGFAGILLLFFDPQSFDRGLHSGDLIVMAAVFLWGANAVYIKTINQDFHAIHITWYPMLVGVPLFFLGGALFDPAMVKQVSSSVIYSIIYQSFVTASFAFLVWNSLLQRYGATALHSFIFLMPVTGVLFGVLLLDDPMTVNLFLSLVLIAAGILLVNVRYDRPLQN